MSVSYVFVLDTSLILVVDSVLYDIDLEILSVAKKKLWVLDVAKIQKCKSRGYLMSAGKKRPDFQRFNSSSVIFQDNYI